MCGIVGYIGGKDATPRLFCMDYVNSNIAAMIQLE